MQMDRPGILSNAMNRTGLVPVLFCIFIFIGASPGWQGTGSRNRGAPVSMTGCWGFESLRACFHGSPYPQGCFFIFWEGMAEDEEGTVH